MSKDEKRGVSRRSFVKGSALTALAAMAGSGVASMYGCSAQSGEKTAEQAAPEEKVIWNACHGCGVCTCPLQFHVQDGTITYVETDTTGSKEFGGVEGRACLRGRSIRRHINHPDRLLHPMKRVGKRGEGKFERISWDEALDLFYDNLKRVIDTYGNDAVFKNCAGGTHAAFGLGGDFARLMNLIGGYLSGYGTDSETQAEFAAGYMLCGGYSGG
ncbi:molybdopterin-dependent oxidoreductase, partial [Raoultibacter timonensis]|uniref:molybdopterin-dependent oxidoreductase n=1 Tax=Raoultibacter timonensis TaxID=1907662 RepID=UPI0011AEE2E1